MTGRCLGDRVADLADGRMPPAEAERAFAHVASCSACRAALDAQRAATAALEAAPEPAPSSDFLSRLSAIADTHAGAPEPAAPEQAAPVIPAQSGPAGVRPTGPAGTRPRTSRRPRRRVVVATAAGAAVLAVAAAVGVSSAGVGAVTPPRPSFGPVVDTFSVEHSVSVDTMPLSGPRYETAAFGTSPTEAPSPSTAP